LSLRVPFAAFHKSPCGEVEKCCGYREHEGECAHDDGRERNKKMLVGHDP
jgi:hypothetical protein